MWLLHATTIGPFVPFAATSVAIESCAIRAFLATSCALYSDRAGLHARLDPAEYPHTQPLGDIWSLVRAIETVRNLAEMAT